MSQPDAGRRATAAREITQLSLFDRPPPQEAEPLAPPPIPAAADSSPPIVTPGCLPGGAILWAASFAGDARGPRERLVWAAARYRARFGRAHAIVAVSLAELDTYRAAGVMAVGDARLAKDCLYLLHPPDGREREQPEEDA